MIPCIEVMLHNTVVRITAAVFETLQPLLNGIRSDIATLTEMTSQQNETLRQLKERMASLEDNEPPNLTEMVSQQSKTLRHLIENELPSFKDMLRQQNETLRQLNDSVVSLVELDTTASVQLTSLEGQVSSNHLELTSKLESLCDMTIEDVSSELSDKIEESEKQITDRLLEIRQEMPVKGFTCGGTEGWRRVAYLDMTDLSTNCPSSWNITEHSKRSCGYFSDGCDSLFFSVSGGYNRVCGRIRAYQSDVDVAFYGYNRLRYTTIDEPYFSGVAVMHGSPRQHIWTFAAGIWENYTEYFYFVCPCDLPYTTPTPPFIGEDYFCESGYVYPNYRFHSNDTLWDGKDCHSTSTCCSLHSPPYFTKTLSETTTDDIELKTCNLVPGSIAIELIEIYVKQNYLQNELKEHDTQMKKSFVHQTNNINNLHVHTCGGTGGWRRAVYLDMTDPSTNCPSGWQQIAAIRACTCTGGSQRTCDSIYFPIHGGPYSQVCGRIRAYQLGIPHAFTRGRGSIDEPYFSGVAVMHGNPRQHIWTFAAGAWENNTRQSTIACPCDTTANISIPQFVGEDYFCESGYVYPGYYSSSLEYTFHSNDTLWDGKDCHSTSTCCSLHNPPYFTKTLSETTTDDLELRMCFQFNSVAIELIELHVK